MKLQAETTARALALRCGALTVDEIVVWADAVILEEPAVDPRLFDVSLAKTPAAILSALNVFGASTEKPRVARLAFRFFHASLVAGRADFSRIAKALYDMVGEHYVPYPGQGAPMWAFWDTYDLATDGIARNVEEVEADMLAYLHANME